MNAYMQRNFNQNNNGIITFVRNDCNDFQITMQNYLQNNINIFDFLPKDFNITTINGSSNFNTEMLKNTSSVISQFLQDNPDQFKYHLDIKDENNVLGKLEKLYQGESVIFDENELPICRHITDKLNIVNCPNFMKLENHRNPEPNFVYGASNKYKVEISKKNFILFIKEKMPRNFTIRTNKNEYNCNIYGIHSSAIIDQFLKENSKATVYEFNYEDEFNEFQPICDFFNFEYISITTNNMDSIKEISEDLQIQFLAQETDTFITDFDKFTQKLDDQQEKVDKVNELFDLLSGIKKETVTNIKNSIVESDWSKTEEKVQELVAFLLQVVNSSLLHHRDLVNLLVQLDKESDESNHLKILLPFFVSKLKDSFGTSIQNCSFFYNLFKEGIIKRDELDTQLNMHINKITNSGQFYNQNNINYDNIRNKKALFNVNYTLIFWFLPEIIELKGIKKSDSFILNSSLIDSFVSTYFDKIDIYKKMRDNGEPDDELTLALRHDDVDALQGLISVSNMNDKCVPLNIFEEFIPNGFTNYLNYSAAYGSIKCFKYLLLNHIKVDEQSIKYAVYGGNLEIIKIVEQNQNEFTQTDKKELNNNGFNNFNGHNNFNGFNNFNGHNNFNGFNNFNGHNNLNNSNDLNKFGCNRFGFGEINGLSDYDLICLITPAIVKHKNDLFDWILENNLTKNNFNMSTFADLIRISLESGNAHSFVELLDKCFHFTNSFLKGQQNMLSYREIIEISCKNGFYLLTQIIINTVSKKVEGQEGPKSFSFEYFSKPFFGSWGSLHNSIDKTHAVSFGNLSIIKLFIKDSSQFELDKILSMSVLKGYENIVKYFLNDLVKTNVYKITAEGISQALSNSVMKKSSKLFDYIMEQVNLKYPDFFEKFDWSIKMLSNACIHGNVKCAKAITEFILKSKKNEDFTLPFVNAASFNSFELCHFFVDKKVNINFSNIATFSSEMASMKEEIFLLIIDKLSHDEKENLYKKIIIPAIRCHNIPLVEIIYKEIPVNRECFFEAVESGDCEIVKITLKYKNNSSFINKKSPNGTPLIIATRNNDTDIVKALLSVPEINPNLYDRIGDTPLIIAAMSMNLDILNLILDFYGDEIQNQKSQLDSLILKTMNLMNIPEWKSKQDIINIVNRVLDIKFIDPNVFKNDNTMLMLACESNEINIVKKLLKFDSLEINAYNKNNGNNSLMIAIQNKNIDVAELLINHPKIDINSNNYGDQTALTIAVKNELIKIVDLLINHESFDPEESRLNYSFGIANNEEIAKKLVSSKYLDINESIIDVPNQQIRYGNFNSNQVETPLTIAVKNNNQEMVDLIIHHPSFDKTKSKLYLSIFLSANKNEIVIFRKLIEMIDDDFNRYKHIGRGLLSFLTNNRNISNEMIDEILSNPKLVFDEIEIKNAFNNCFHCHGKSFNLLTKVYDYDKKHGNFINLNKSGPFGKSYFTYLLPDSDFRIVNFLLENGADPNIPDISGYYPLECAINMNSLEFVLALIDSNKIDYSKRIIEKPNDFQSNKDPPSNSNWFFNSGFSSNQGLISNSSLKSNSGLESNPNQFINHITYLHLAARSVNEQILEIFLDNKLIDVNVTDDFGNTPLIDACKFKILNNIERLFKVDNLDYSHCNHYGKDALKTLSPNLIRNDSKTLSKDEYLALILNHFENPNLNFAYIFPPDQQELNNAPLSTNGVNLGPLDVPMTASSLGDSLPTIGSNSAANTTENKPTESQSNSAKSNTDEYEASRSKKVESKDSPDQLAIKDHSQTREIICQPADNMSPNDQKESNSFNSFSLSFVTDKSDKSGTSAFKFGEFDLSHFVKSNKPDLVEPVAQKNESEPSNLPPLDPDEKPISDSKNLKPHPPKSSPGKNKRFHSSPRRIGMFPSLHSKKHGDEEDQSEIAQQQIAQMIEADNKKQKQFNQQMKKQAELMKKMQMKASRSRRKNDE